jgi:peptide-methionine (S)-S-oxide reductase
MKSIVLGGGCFWCLEATYQLVKGVSLAVPGYAGGKFLSPDWYNIQDHAEVVKIEYDELDINLSNILDIFWVIHDPTTLNRQGNDVGSQYRSIILYSDDKQFNVIEESLKKANETWDGKIITEVKKLEKFHEAEEYHHNYFLKNPSQAYCQIVINPKISKLKNNFEEYLK